MHSALLLVPAAKRPALEQWLALVGPAAAVRILAAFANKQLQDANPRFVKGKLHGLGYAQVLVLAQQLVEI